MVSNTATVLRLLMKTAKNARLELPIDQLVPGDIIKLAAGDMIPGGFTDYPARFVCRPCVADRRNLCRLRKSPRRVSPGNNPLECYVRCALWGRTS